MINLNELEEYFGDVSLINNDIMKVDIGIGDRSEYYYFTANQTVFKKQFFLISENIEVDDYANFIFKKLELVNFDSFTKIKINEFQQYKFDNLLLVPSNYHHFFDDDFLEKRENLMMVIPIFDCEFSVHESIEDFNQIAFRNIKTKNFERVPSPKIKIKYNNPKTKVKTINNKYTITGYESLVVYIADMYGVDDSFLNLLNYKNDEIKITSPSNENFYIIEFNGEEKKYTKDNIYIFLDSFIF